nr:hypothetical protein [Tanacetum cinerariifolium]
MVAILEKSDAAEGFEQIIDFLSGSYINHALTVNPHVYISCMKQFWNTDLLKRSGDVTRLQALVDKKRIVITEEVVHEILQLNDAEGVICLPNEEIFAGLARMGYEKPSTNLTFYKAFFLTQWKFFIHTILHYLSAKRTSWNKFSSAMASAVICLSSGQRFNFSNYIFESLVCNVDSSSKFYMYPRFIQLIIQTNIADLSTHTNRYISPILTQKVFANMRRVGKGFSGVETPLFGSMLLVRNVAEEAEAEVPAQGDDVQEPAAEEVVTDVVPPTPTPPSPPSPVILSSPPHQPPCPPQPQDAAVLSLLFQQVLDTCSALARRVEGLENEKAAQQLEIVKLKGRIIVDMDQDEGIELVADQEKDAEVKERHADKQAELYNLDLDHSSKVVTAAATQFIVASTPIPAAKPKILNITAAPAVSTRRRKGVVIRDPEEELSFDTPAETPKMKDKGKGILIEAPKPMKKKDQIELDVEYARKLQEEINKEHEKSYKNIDWNTALDHVQSKEPYINETPAQKAAKRRKLHEQAKEDEDLKKQLEVVINEDDDVFIEATPIGRKVPVVDYEIVMINNKPKYKIIMVDGTHQLYISFLTLLKNFDREDLEDLWRIVKARFSTSKPTNFSDDYLLYTLKTMFEKTYGQDAIWRNQQSVYGQALVKSWKLLTSCGVHIISLTTTTFILLVEKRYPLSKFTLEQLVNVVRLKVEEESEMSLELLRFTRQQL